MFKHRFSFTTLVMFSLFVTSCLVSAVVLNQVNAQENEGSSRMLRHVVMFKFKPDASEADIAKVVKAFGELPSKIDTIADYEFGTNNSPEGLNDGFTHCFLVTFKTEEGRATYLPHPAHKAFVDVLKPHLDKAMVIDYWSEK